MVVVVFPARSVSAGVWVGAREESPGPERLDTGWTLLFDDNIATGRSSLQQRYLIVSHGSTDSIKAAQPLIRTQEPVPPGITEPHVQRAANVPTATVEKTV